MSGARRHPATVTEIAAAVAAGELAPTEVVGDAINRLVEGDAHHHVVAHGLYEEAMAQARAADDAVAHGEELAPLHGVPIGVKDLYDIAGHPTAAGSTILADNIAGTTATAVRRLQEAGAIVVAKTTMTEFAGAAHHPAFPAPVNPYDPDRSPAGSSSGSGVAVAAGLLPAALGSDTVASIRLPAAWNGCVGFKPSYGRVSRHGVFPLASTYDHCGPLTRTVRDADVLTRVMAGADALDPTARLDPYGDPPDGVAGMRIGWDEAFATERVQPVVVAASRAVITALAAAGAHIVDVTIPLRVDAAGPYYALLRAEIAAAHRVWWPNRADEYSRSFAGILAGSAEVHRDDVIRAHEFRIGFRHAVDRLFDEVDALVTPTSPLNAPPVLPGDDVPFDDSTVGLLTFTWLWNFCGAPAISIPWGLDAEGLPNSVQLIAAPGADPVAVAAAAAAEAAAPNLPPPPTTAPTGP
ncbi:MAG: amidase [Actinomycetota bacterium]